MKNPMLNDNWCKFLPGLVKRPLGQLVLPTDSAPDLSRIWTGGVYALSSVQ